MPNKIPHFQYFLNSPQHKHFRCIVANMEEIHHISNTDEFYAEFGYTAEMGRGGVLPEEFIWEEYIKDGGVNFSSCMQMHIVEYLNKHSATFRNRYGDHYDSLVATHASARAARGVACAACRMNKFCETPT